jgi:methionine sulfoxide reductase heme-binding subunit
MTITSFKSTANLLGSRGWLILHTVGMYYLWLAFIHTFASRLNESLTLYIPFVSILAIALIIRLFALRKARKMSVKSNRSIILKTKQ